VTNPDVDQLLASVSAEVRELARQTRALILDVLPAEILETVGGTDIGYGWTRGYKGLICVINVHAGWVNLGLADGAKLPDPAGLLQGTGKRHRHVRISTLADLERPELRELLEAASQAQS
jgi:hypothetical protein